MRLSFKAAYVLGAALFASPIFATPLAPIDLTIDGNTQVTATQINFNTVWDGTGTYVASPGAGQFATAEPIQSIFAANGVVASETGAIYSLDATKTPVGTTIVPPMLFMTFSGTTLSGGTAGGTNLDLYLTQLVPGSFAAGSPFDFQQTSNGAVASFNVDGYVWNTTTSSMTDFTGTFSATFNGLSVSELTNPANLPQDTAFTGTFSITIIPEPASILLMGVGLLGAGLVARRKVRS